LVLPTASKHQKDPPRKAWYISVQTDGQLFLNKETLPLEDLLPRLINLRTDDPDLNVIVRGDGKAKYRQIRAVLDICQQANLAKVDLATEIAK
jgi:biopolymer transport protein ExbD